VIYQFSYDRYKYIQFSIFRNVDFGDILTPEVKAAHKNTSYDLIANIVHDGEPNKGTYRVHVLKQGNSKWYEMQDLHVSDILPQMITLTEAYIQVTIMMMIISIKSNN